MNNSIQIVSEKKYQWNQDWANRIAHTDINLVIDELKAIEDVHGAINPNLIIESSKNKKSVLHSYFEWDNEKAANSWRTIQARRLLTNIEVKIISDGKAKVIRVYETVKRGMCDVTQNSFKNFESISQKDLALIKKWLIKDLNSIIKRMERNSFISSVDYIKKAIEELQKEEEIKVIPINTNESIEAVTATLG